MNGGNGDSTLSQSFVVPGAGLETLVVTYKVACPDTLANDQVWVTLDDDWTQESKTLLDSTCTNDGAWHMLSTDVRTNADHQLMLTFHVHDGGQPNPTTALYVDNVVLN